MKYKSVLISYKFWIFFLVCALLAELVANWIWTKDALLQESKNWLGSQEQVTSQLGVIKKIKIKESLYYQGDENKAAYNRYTLFVYGEKNKAVIILRASTDGSSENQFTLMSLRIRDS